MKDKIIKNLKNFQTYVNSIESNIRRPNFPEYISENIILFSLLNQGLLIKSKIKSGNILLNNKIIECKSFSSSGPISFGPNYFDKLYILDSTNHHNFLFNLYQIDMNFKEFKYIYVSKNEMFKDQIESKRRPRITWSKLYPQIKHKTSETIISLN